MSPFVTTSMLQIIDLIILAVGQQFEWFQNYGPTDRQTYNKGGRFTVGSHFRIYVVLYNCMILWKYHLPLNQIPHFQLLRRKKYINSHSGGLLSCGAQSRFSKFLQGSSNLYLTSNKALIKKNLSWSGCILRDITFPLSLLSFKTYPLIAYSIYVAVKKYAELKSRPHYTFLYHSSFGKKNSIF